MTKITNRNLLKWFLFLSLLLNIIAGIYIVRKLYRQPPVKAYTPPPKPAYYLDRDKLFDVLPKDSNAIIFLGNSLTQYFELAEFFQDIHIKNRGIHGDMLDGVLKRLTPIIASQPGKIFIELGVNDIEQNVPQDKVIERYKRLLDTLKTTCPGTKLYVQSLLPVADSSQYLPTSYCSQQMNKSIVAVNNELRKLAEMEQCTFIDAYSQFVFAGQLNPKYSVDGVHLSGEGYLLWTRILKPYVDEK